MPETPAVAGPDVRARRAALALAGHTGDVDAARNGLTDVDPGTRAVALGALWRLGHGDAALLAAALADPGSEVRRRACELAASLGPPAAAGLVACLDDPDARVVEAACFGLGEIGPDLTGHPAVAGLARMCGSHDDPLCREAAVAALGAIGDPVGLPAILAAGTDRPAVRRRATLALAPFDGPEVDEALARAATDRDWQVRQAAEDLTDPGRT